MPFCEILEPGGLGGGEPGAVVPSPPSQLAEWLLEAAAALPPQTGGGRPGAPSTPLVFGLLSSTPTLLQSPTKL